MTDRDWEDLVLQCSDLAKKARDNTDADLQETLLKVNRLLFPHGILATAGFTLNGDPEAIEHYWHAVNMFKARISLTI